MPVCSSGFLLVKIGELVLDLCRLLIGSYFHVPKLQGWPGEKEAVLEYLVEMGRTKYLRPLISSVEEMLKDTAS